MIHLGKKASIAVPVLCAVSLALGACNADSAPAGTIHTDSPGVRIATAVAPRWGPGEGWTVSGTPTLDIGRVSGDSEYLFDHVIGAVRLSTGDIVIGTGGPANSGATTLVVPSCGGPREVARAPASIGS